MSLANKENITIENFKNIGLTIGFIILLILPTVQKYFPVIPELESTENRQLAGIPIVKYGNKDSIPTLYEKYYNDHFSLRNQLVRLKSLTITKTLNKSPMPDKVIFGKDNWLFSVHKELNTYRGKERLKQEEIDRITTEMVRRKSYLDKKNISLYFVIVPTKYTVYAEYLPNYIDKLNEITSTDLVKEALNKGGIDVLDLRDTLINAKNNGLLYYKTDNHWNELGSFFASKTILDKIKKEHPNIPTFQLNDFSITQEIKNGGNTARLINMEDQFDDINFNLDQKTPSQAKKVKSFDYPAPQDFPYPWEYVMTYEVANDSLPKLLLIRDSFGGSVIPFINQGYRRSVFLFDNWNYTSNEHIIENEQPDIVVYLVLECLWDGFLAGVDKSQTQKEN